MRKFATFAAMTALLVFAGAGFLQAKTFVIPHIVEASGTIATPYTFDTLINVVYVGGLTGGAPVVGTAEADVDFYFFDNKNGDLMLAQGPGTPVVCGPCKVHLENGARKAQFNVDKLVTARLAGWTGGRNGFGVLVATGDTDNLSIQGFVTNSHTGPQDVAVFGFAPVEIGAPAN